MDDAVSTYLATLTRLEEIENAIRSDVSRIEEVARILGSDNWKRTTFSNTGISFPVDLVRRPRPFNNRRCFIYHRL